MLYAAHFEIETILFRWMDPLKVRKQMLHAFPQVLLISGIAPWLL